MRQMALKPVLRSVAKAVEPLSPVLRPLHLDPKTVAEFSYWWKAHRREGELGNGHYESLFTSDIGVERSFYTGKRVLDIGCGPRGSLEWADDATQRVGLDPLVDSYRRFGIDEHEMDYVSCGSEAIPFPDEHFDVVTTINSLDHVDDTALTISEICRVVAPEGTVIVLVDIREQRTVAEPHTFGWDLADRFPGMDVVRELHYEVASNGHGGIAGVHRGLMFDHANPSTRNGVMMLELRKRTDAQTS